MILIGYWYDEQWRPRKWPGSQWPHPAAFKDPAWDAAERLAVIEYLEAGHALCAAGGSSRCRCCDVPNGSAELTDGTYVWPEGLAHYLREHEVRLPQRVTNHVFAGERVAVADLVMPGQYDYDWWLSLTSWRDE